MQEMTKIMSKQYSNIALRVIKGHFITPNSHVNYYLDMTGIKSRLSEASAAAKELSTRITATTIVDTIVCIDGCEIIGAFLAEELTRAGVYSMNAHKTIYIITPELVNTGQLVFRENYIPMVKGKNVLLLLASVTTGQTIVRAMQTLHYYGASVSGITAVFSTANSMMGIPIHALFTLSDLPDYKTCDHDNCLLCKNKEPIDAFANAFGYSRME